MLSALSLQPGELTPEFDPATRGYEVDVASATAVTVMATASWPEAEVAITPSDASDVARPPDRPGRRQTTTWSCGCGTASAQPTTRCA